METSQVADISESILLAVSLKGSITCFQEENSIILGTVLIHNKNIVLKELRSELKRTIPALPSNFQFVTKESWPISIIYEDKVKVNQIIGTDNILRISRKFELPPVGIKWEDTPIGFIFVNLSDTLQQIRETIQKELNKTLPDSFIYINQQKRWPVTKDQECKLIGWDVLYHDYFALCSPTVRYNFANDTENVRRKKQKRNFENNKLEMSVEERRKSLPNLNFNQDKRILISYVKAEAFRHARDLKRELTDLGFNVFLDVDEIQAGNDWQDKLNDAVGNCGIFVPLITPQYGLTRWTNREIKLADVMEKTIIPINFLDYWPPDCLSIQFSALQYIPWKTLGDFEKAKSSGEEDRSKDIRFWDQIFVHRAAKSIESSYKTLTNEKNTFSLLSRKPSLRSYPSPISEEFSTINKPKDGSILIIISVHPKQQKIGNELRNKLQNKNIEVWCSTDDLEKDYEDSCSSVSISPVTPTPMHLSSRSHSAIYNSSQSDNDINEIVKKTDFQFTNSFENGTMHFSQLSNSQSSTLPVTTINKLKIFKNKTDEANVVVIILSQAYCSSKTSNKQVYYCEHRKRTIVVKTEEFTVPSWITHLLGVNMIEYSKEDSFKNIQQELKAALEISNTALNCKYTEDKIQHMAKPLYMKMQGYTCVYITGNTKFYNAKTENICHAIGQELATLKFITLVTGGFFGVCEAVGRSFCEDREAIGEKPGRVYHILPKYDAKDYMLKGRQNSDGSFQKVPYGQTIFIGNSMEERIAVVARIFNICILIEGGPRVANEIQEFIWNDHIIIPVVSTGGAASGKFGISSRILEVPPGVNEEDWLVLAKQDVTADDVGRSVKRIVCSLAINTSSYKKSKKNYKSTNMAKRKK